MKKLKDLKENECVLITKNNLRQKAIGLLGGIVYDLPKKFMLVKHGKNYFWNVNFTNEKITFLDESDFIKPKKSKLKKRVEHIENVLANMERKPIPEPIGNTEHLEAGKWYKYSSGALQFNKAKGNGYGINDSGNWVSEALWLADKNANGTNYHLASKEEVEAALISEAKKRGYRKGMVIHAPNAECNAILKDLHDFIYRKTDNALVYMYNDYHGIPIMVDGIWAEIILQPEEKAPNELTDDNRTNEVIMHETRVNTNEITKEKLDEIKQDAENIIKTYSKEIDWSEKGKILSDDYGGLVMNTGIHKYGNFSGLVIKSCIGGSLEGTYSEHWNKLDFKIYTKKITLKND